MTDRKLTPAQLLWEEQEAEAGGSGHLARERAPQGKGGGGPRGGKTREEAQEETWNLRMRREGKGAQPASKSA